MDSSIFGTDSAGYLVDTPHKVQAFVPYDLPPVLDLADLIVPLQEARDAIAELRGASRRLGNPYILVRPLQRREALTSSAMEGTFTTDDNLLIADAGMDEASDQASIEVRNYLRAHSEALRMIQEDGLPICHKVIRTAHDILLSGVGKHRGSNRNRGTYKNEQNAIGGIRSGIESARFVPPPPSEAQRCMDQLEAYINRENRHKTPPLIDMALVHYQLETIHPFSDGNGRVGRMLISLMAVERKLFETPLLYVSPELEDQKDEYIDLMLAVSTHGAWEDWVRFFLKVVEDSARNSIKVVDRLIDLQLEYRERVTKATKAANAVGLVDMLFVTPFVTVRDVQDAFNVTYRAARNTIDKLVDQEILHEISYLHPTAFIAREIMHVADRR